MSSPHPDPLADMLTKPHDAEAARVYMDVFRGHIIHWDWQ